MRGLLKCLFGKNDRSPEPIRDPWELYSGRKVELHNYADSTRHHKVMDCTILYINREKEEVTLKNNGPEDQFDPGPNIEYWSFYRLGLNNSRGKRSVHHCLVPKR